MVHSDLSKSRVREKGSWHRILKNHVLYWCLGVAGAFAQVILARPIYSWEERLMATVPLVIMLVSIYRYFNQPYRSVPVIQIITIQIYIFYSMPQFSQEFMPFLWGIYSPSQDILVASTILVVLGEAICLLGYEVASKWILKGKNLIDRLYPRPKSNWGLVIMPYALVAFGIYTLCSLRPDYIPVSIRYLLFRIFNVHLSQILLLYLGIIFGKSKYLIMGYIVTVSMSFVGLVQGMVGSIVLPFLILFLSFWIWGKTIRVRWMVFVILVIIVINPVKSIFRQMTWDDKDVSSIGAVERRLTGWGSAFENTWFGTESKMENILRTAERLNDLFSFALVVDLVPRAIPFNNGEDLELAAIYWIPRLIWPEKIGSSDLLYNKYATIFGYTTIEGTERTTIGASVFSEAYWNFGIGGVLFFLLLSGLILGINFGNNGRNSEVSIIICLVYFAGVVQLLSALTVTIPSLITFYVGTLVAMKGIGFVTQVLRKMV